MKRLYLLALCALLLVPGMMVDFAPSVSADPGAVAANWEGLSSSPKDDTPYVRDLVPSEESISGLAADAGAGSGASDLTGVGLGPCIFPAFRIVDPVIANTDANLTNTDVRNDGETTISINPANTDEIIISSFAGGWSGAGTTAPLYHSTDGGATWTRVGVPTPPGWVQNSCPCDWAWDWGLGGRLSGTILAVQSVGVDIVSVVTTNPASVAAYAYNGNPAQLTNNLVPGSYTGVDQPWLLTNRTIASAAVDNVYVAYDDFNNTDGISGVDMRCAVSSNASPLNFTTDVQLGNSTGSVNPGLRMANDRGSGVMWALWGRNVAAGDDTSKNIDYMLNRSTDGGATWTLNGDPGLPTTAGIVVANADSTQPQPKFGTVNALLGGVHHAAVDPNNGDLYYVFGNRDPATNNNRLSVRRITDAGGGLVAVGAASFVTGQVEAALPSVAVTDNGIVGVFYYTYDGMSGGFPQFTAHFSISSDQGATWTDQVLLQFLSSATDNGDPRQRVLGDYVQVKAVGTRFFGAFTANGAGLGRPYANHDPIFFTTCVPSVKITCPPDGTAECGALTTRTFGVDEVNGLGVTVTFDVDGTPVPGQTKVVAAGASPTTVDFDYVYSGAPGTPYVVTATGTNTAGEVFACSTTVTVIDTTPPVVMSSIGRTILWPATFGLLPMGYAASATDSCEGVLPVSVTVYSDQANGPPPYTPDVLLPGGPATLRIRAERAVPGGAGRVYVVAATATDAGLNTTASVKYVVCPLLPTTGNLMALNALGALAAAECTAGSGGPPVTPTPNGPYVTVYP